MVPKVNTSEHAQMIHFENPPEFTDQQFWMKMKTSLFVRLQIRYEVETSVWYLDN